MDNLQLKKLLYSGLLLAVAIAVQNLRLILPLPPFISMFIIGSLINMLLLLTALSVGIRYGAALSLLLAGEAFLQGQLPLIFMVPVVALGNALLAAGGALLWQSRLLWLVPVLKMAFLWLGTWLVLTFLAVPNAAVLLMMMSWPQLITGCCGVLLARLIWRRVGCQFALK